jgi:hypothetical protein
MRLAAPAVHSGPASIGRSWDDRLDTVRRIWVAQVIVVLVLVTTSTAGATTDGAIGHRQAFVGRVNGSFDGATVYMACFGPVTPGQTGHPMAGQVLEVLSPLPPIVVGPIHPGYTGSAATTIVARLKDAPRAVLARFTNYFQTEEIPTSAELPCAGTGVVRFVPRPRSATSRAAWVTVSFVGQP